jgi:serine/threonine-protein kinase
MRLFEQVNTRLRRAVLLGAALSAVASLPPAQIAQRADSAMLSALTHWLPATRPDIIIVRLSEFDAVPTLASGTRATIIGPTAIALGPISNPDWAGAGLWLLALLAALGLMLTGGKRLPAWLLTVAGPGLLLLGSAGALLLASLWLPVTAPALFLATTGLLILQTRKTGSLQPAGSPTPTAGLNADLLRQWQVLRELPVTEALLPEFYALADTLAGRNEPQLAADVFLRMAVTDPDYRDVAHRLVSTGAARTEQDQIVRERMRDAMPANIGRYRVLEPVGQGATGRVFLAWDPKLSRLVAIKLIDLSLERDEVEVEDARVRFLREAELTARLSHPDIVTIYDLGESDGGAFFAMEYLKGDMLSRFTAADTLLPPALVLNLGARTADALDFAHRRNVIHRDIKPANIMYDSVSGDLKITDFGIARSINVTRTRTGVVLGTPSFMSPEQIEGGNVKGHTDLFALGVSLYELLTGQLPFRGNSMTDLMFVIANEPHEPVSQANPDLPPRLDSLFDRALHKDPAQRFANGSEMAGALRSALAQLH